MQYNEELYKNIQQFLQDSSGFYAADNERARADLEFYSGKQWNQEFFTRGDNRPKMMLSELPKYVTAIQSAAKKSPFHTELSYTGDQGDPGLLKRCQDALDRIEADSSYRSVMLKGLYQGIIMGVGAVDVTTVKGPDGKPRIEVEHIRDISTVAWDPDCEKADMSDAGECAIVTWMPKRRVVSLYGQEVADINEDDLNFGTQWKPNDKSRVVPVITYYEKLNDGVHVHKLVGKYEIEAEVTLNIDRIPVFKLSGFEVFRNDKFVSVGIVDKVKELQIGINLAYSTLVERMNRSVKAGYICEAEALEGLTDQVGKLASGDVPLFLYKHGFTKPEQIRESFEVADLQAIITSSQALISSVIGIPSAGVNGIQDVTKTATETLVQQENSESNVDAFYQSLEDVSKDIGSVICQLILKTPELPFTVRAVNGPGVVSRNMRRRQELITVSSLLPDNMKPLVAILYARTLDDEVKQELGDSIVANLPAEIKLVGETEDPAALHIIAQSKAMIEQQQAALDELQKRVDELTQENQTLSLSIIDNREARELDLAKALLTNEREAAKDRAEIALKSAEIAAKYEADVRDSNLQAAKMVQDQINENNAMVESELGRIPAAIEKSPDFSSNLPDASFAG